MPTYRKTMLERIEFQPLKLDNDKVPLIIDDWTLAFRMGFTGKALWYVLGDVDDQYKVFKIKKASGGMRTIHNPKPIMRLMAKQLRVRVMLPLTRKLGAHVGAYQEGKSAADSARVHVVDCDICAAADKHTCTVDVTLNDIGKVSYDVERSGTEECAACKPTPKHDCPRRGVKIHMDLKDFFTSTRRAWIRKYFHEVVGYNHYASSLIAQLCTVKFQNKKRGKTFWGVPQGAPFSGDICNLVADWRLDHHIIKALEGWTYTRYADDLYFSYPKNLPRDEVNAVIDKITSIINDAGYRVNKKKLHVQRPHRRQKLLGVVLNQKVGMPRDEFRRFRSILNNCIVNGFQAEYAKHKKENPEQFKGWLVGKISYFKSIDPHKAALLSNMYEVAREKHWGKDGNIVEEVFDYSPPAKEEVA